MSLTRREYLASTLAAGLATLHAQSVRAAEESGKRPGKRKFGMCDWSLKREDPTVFEWAEQIGLDGVEVSVGTRENNLWLRRKEIQERYLQTARDRKIAIPSLAMGELNHVPLMSEPRAALWVADTIEIARQMKAQCILLAFFSKGTLKAENQDDMRRTTEVLAELAPRAEKAGVVLGIESYLSAEDHMKIIDAVKSKAVKVYLDVYNMAKAGYDPIAGMKTLGSEICQIHFKDVPSLEQGSGLVDWPKVVETVEEIKYPGWIVLETGSPSKDVVEDAKKNLDYVRRLFSV